MILRSCFIVAFLIQQNVYASNKRQGSLALVIDDTKSMQKEINQVKDAAVNIIAKVLNGSATQNVVLVTFNDPENRVKLLTKTRSVYKLKNKLEEINANGGADCPEYSLTGIKKALENSYDNSYIFVFTDASPKDYYLTNKIKSLAQAKQSQINFILTPAERSCRETDFSRRFKYYYDIATSTFGQVIKLDNKEQINQVLNFVIDIASGNKNILASETNLPSNVVTDVPFTVDDQTEYIIISASGQDVDVFVPGTSTPFEKLTWIPNAKVLKLNNPQPGSYTASVIGSSKTSITIFGRTDFNFQHGFSEELEKEFNNDVKQPVYGKMYHLLISVADPSDSTLVQQAQILDKNGNVISEMPLRKISANYYATDLFEPPDSTEFLVQIKGHERSSGRPIIRKARTLINVRPENSETSENLCGLSPLVDVLRLINNDCRANFNNTKERDSYLDNDIRVSINCPYPIITIEEHGTKEYTSKLWLICKVKANQKPEIIWKDDNGNILSNTTTTSANKDHYENELLITELKESQTFHCYAENDQGQSTKHINVVLNSSVPVEDNNETGTAKKDIKHFTNEVNYGSNIELICTITSQSTPIIHWNNSKNEKLIPYKLENLEPHTYKSYLKISNVILSDTYLCEAHTDVGLSTTKIDVHVKNPININIHNYVKQVKFGQEATLTCNIASNSPMKITWSRIKESGEIKVNDNFDFTISEDGKTIKIHKVIPELEGKYICKGFSLDNKYIPDEHIFTVTGSVPQITIEEKGSKEFNEKLQLTCKVQSYPQPKIIWKDDDGNVLSDVFTKSLGDNNYESVLTIEKFKGTQTYYCYADNNRGQSTKGMEVNVKTPFIVENINTDANVIFDTENTAILHCKVKSKYPIHIDWYQILDPLRPKYRRLIENSDKYTIKNDGAELRIDAVNREDGNYLCKVSLDENRNINTNIFFDMTKLPPRDVAMDKPESIQLKENGSVILRCKVKEEHPRPEITWHFKPYNSSVFQQISNLNELRIAEANLRHVGVFKCIAQSSKGIEYHFTELTVLTKPKITILDKNEEELKTNFAPGSDIVMVCEINSFSGPVFVWRNGDNEKLLSNKIEFVEPFTFKSYLTLTNVTKPESYSCKVGGEVIRPIVKKVNVTEENTSHLDVPINKPIISIEYEGDNTLKCDVTSENPMKITWFRTLGTTRTKIIRNSDEFSLSEDGAKLMLQNVETDLDATYKCVASYNELKEDELPPTVDSAELEFRKNKRKTLQLVENQYDNITCNVNKEDYPHLKITWLFKGFNSDQFQKLDENTTDIFIENVKFDNSGVYKCLIEHAKGIVEQETELTVFTAPVITMISTEGEERNSNIDHGNDIVFVCEVKAYSKPKFVWTNSIDEELKPDRIEFKKPFTYKSYLTVRNVTQPESYSCEAGNEIPVVEFVHLNVRKLANIKIESNDEGILKCEVTSDSPIRILNITWLRTTENPKKTEEINNSENVSISENGRELKVHDEVTDSKIEYTCKVLYKDDEQKVQTDRRNETFTAEGSFEITRNIRNTLRVNENQSATLRCNVKKPHTNITWQFKGFNSDRFQIIPGNSKELIINKARFQNGGVYKCRAQHNKGIVEHETELTVLTTPIITMISTDGKEIKNNIDHGSDIVLVCEINSYSKPKFVWMNGNKELQPDKVEFEKPFTFKSYLTVRNVMKPESYSCKANDENAQSVQAVKVNVRKPPKMRISKDGDGLYNCIITSDTPIKIFNITWYRTIDYSEHIEVIQDSDEFSLSADGTELKVYNEMANPDNVIKYTCEASYMYFDELSNIDQSKIHFTSGLDTPKLTIFDFHGDEIKGKVAQGSDIVLVCEVDSDSRPQFVWVNGNHEKLHPQTSGLYESSTYKSYLKITDISRSDSYSCKVRANGMQSVKTVEVNVKIPANVELEIISDGEGTYTCSISTDIPIKVYKITWYKTDRYGRELIKESDVFSLSDDGSQLKVYSNEPGFQQQYECEANYDEVD